MQEPSFGAVQGGPLWHLRLENLAVFIAALALYRHEAAPWWLFVVLFLAPDLSMCGYLVNSKIGAYTYNAAHNYAAAIVLGAIALFAHVTVLAAIGLIWIAHIGFDRMLGYGLKYPASFGETHLGRLGKPRAKAAVTQGWRRRDV